MVNEQSRETGNIGHTRRRKSKQKHNTICADIAIYVLLLSNRLYCSYHFHVFAWFTKIRNR